MGNDEGYDLYERLAKLEVKTEVLERQQQEALVKLDELLGLRQKGVGAFWVISAITGTGIIGVIMAFLDWIKGNH